LNFETVSYLPLNLSEIFSSMHHPEAGAVVLFSGEVRNHHNGKSVVNLFYEAYESMADKMIREILQEAKIKWDLHLVFAKHRLGEVHILESAVVVITSSAHRTEAYQANRWIIDKIKHTVPIWKKEFYTDGTYEWVNSCAGCETEHEHFKLEEKSEVNIHSNTNILIPEN
jgi:molybdopterin synthase catalytic subunit